MTPTPYYSDDLVTLHLGDALEVARTLDAGSVQTIVTSPPYYGLRDYGVDGQLGAEVSVDEYVARMVALFSELRRVLADDGTLWLNLGDSYANVAGWGAGGGSTLRGTKHGVRGEAGTARQRGQTFPVGHKNLLMVPARVALALQADGWILRKDIIWAKTSGMPEAVKDRPTSSHEHILLLAKRTRYYYDAEAIAEPLAASTVERFAQPNFDEQGGSLRSNGGSREDRPLKAAMRPQLRRAFELFREHGLTDAHIDAIRAVGMNDTGKAAETQTGAGKNAPEVQRLADEAKAALGGYYREFLTGGTKNARDVWRIPSDEDDLDALESVWEIATVPFSEAHFAVFPPAVPRRCILAGSRPGDLVLDPFSGSGTTGMVATQEGRRYVGIDLNREYLDLSLRTRFAQPVLDLTGGDAASSDTMLPIFEPVVTVRCFFSGYCKTVIRAEGAQAAHDQMEAHYAEVHAAEIDRIVGWIA
jgi:DNA modification methylase